MYVCMRVCNVMCACVLCAQLYVRNEMTVCVYVMYVMSCDVMSCDVMWFMYVCT